MASNSEKGHAVNIANYKLLIDKCQGFSNVGKYNPSNPRLTLGTMTGQWTTANTAQITLTTAIETSKAPINDREITFEPVNKLVTRVIGVLNSTDATKAIKKDAKGIADDIRGFKSKPTTNPPDPNTVSTSHQSFVQKADHFKALIELLKTIPLYVPAETDLTTASLDALYTSMKADNDYIGSIITPVDQARLTRDHALYDENIGMVDTAQLCKKYVGGVFGAKAPETRLVSGIAFTRPKKKS